MCKSRGGPSASSAQRTKGSEVVSIRKFTKADGSKAWRARYRDPDGK